MAVTTEPHPLKERLDTGPSPFVVAVVLTWNDIEMTERCLESLERNPYERLQVVLVDNGSDFPTIPPLRERFPDVDMVALPDNFGFTGGCNRGMERALELGAEYVFLLNNDTVVGETAIEELVGAMMEQPDVGVASALLLSPGEEKRIQSYRGWAYPNRAWLHRPGEDDLLTEEYQRTVESEFVSACAVMFRRHALEQVGMFDESLFTNWEDYDLCLRFRKAGWKLLVVGTAEVVHRRHSTTGSTSPFITYFSTRNRLICLFRHGTMGGVIWNTPFILKSFYWKVRGYGFTNWPCHRAFFKGIFHFLIGVRGKGGAPKNRDDKSTGKKRYG